MYNAHFIGSRCSLLSSFRIMPLSVVHVDWNMEKIVHLTVAEANWMVVQFCKEKDYCLFAPRCGRPKLNEIE